MFFKVQYQQLKPRRRWKTTDDEIPASARQFEVHDLKQGTVSAAFVFVSAVARKLLNSCS